ncbi:MAG: lipid-A-disaccharide synthase, partial [Lentisphaerota bacterium]
GDMHAARLVREMKARDPEIRFWGIGGDELRAEGVEILHDVREMAVLGIVEVLRRYSFFKRVFNEMLAYAEERHPDLVLLVDYPGFNLRFAEQARKMNLKVAYYICPQVWAWHRSRIGKMARIVDRLLVIFPFEVEVFRGTGLKTDFVGHPLVEATHEALSAPAQELPWQGEPRVALLPGSRRQEVERILPSMWQAAGVLEKKNPSMSFIVAAPGEEIAELAQSVLRETSGGPSRACVVTGKTREILRQARAAMVASGTATVETALMGCPMIVVYRTSWATYWLGRMLIQVPFLGMVNLVAGRALCPEFIQGAAVPANMAAAIEALLPEGPERSAMISGLQEVRAALSKKAENAGAAELLWQELSQDEE